MDIQALQQQIQSLTEKVEQLSKSSAIPRNVETAFRERLGIASLLTNTVGSTTVITYVSGVSQDGATKLITVTTKTLTFTTGLLTSFT